MKALILRFFFVALCTFGVLRLMPGIVVKDARLALGLVILIAGFNAIIKQTLTQFSVGCSILALGPILLVMNTMMLWFTGFLSQKTAQAIITVENFWVALWSGLVISVVSFFMMMLVSDE